MSKKSNMQRLIMPPGVIAGRERDRMLGITLGLVEVIQAIHLVEMYLVLIDSTALNARGQLLRNNLDGIAGELSDAFTEYALVADRYKYSIDEQLKTDYIERLNGIRCALNDNDNGEYLRAVASKADLLKAMKSRRDAIPKGSAPKRSEVERLCSKMYTYTSAGDSIPIAYDRVCEDLERDHQSALTLEEYNYIQGWTLDAASRAFKRWKKKTGT